MAPHSDGLVSGRKERKRRVVVIVSVVIVSVIILAAFVYWYHSRSSSERNGTYSHEYSLKVEANTTEEYIIRLPVPNDSSGRMPHDFLSELEVIKGVAVFALGDYENETCLEIRASGYLEIEWDKAYPASWNERYGNLTMTTGAEGWRTHDPCYSWIYSSRNDIKMTFYYSSIHHYMASPWFASGGGPTFYFSEYFYWQGWQQITIDYGWLIIN